jgi:hypothetical protein
MRTIRRDNFGWLVDGRHHGMLTLTSPNKTHYYRHGIHLYTIYEDGSIFQYADGVLQHGHNTHMENNYVFHLYTYKMGVPNGISYRKNSVK